VLDRSRFLVVHGVSAEAWAKRWGIEPVTTDCYVCKAPCSTTQPFAAPGGLRGLMAPPCPCGHPTGPYCVVHTSMGMEEFLMASMEPSKPRKKRAKKRRLRLVTS
jgi:hypothetical protein